MDYTKIEWTDPDKIHFRHTEETKAKLSAMRTGKNNPFYGQKHSEEAKTKIRARTVNFNKDRTYSIQPINISIPPLEKLAYIAGLVDGEGSVSIKKEQAQIAIYNCYEPVMIWLKDNVGGNYRVAHRNGRTPNFCWNIGGAKNVYHLLIALTPYLIIKQSQKETVINYLYNKYSSRLWE